MRLLEQREQVRPVDRGELVGPGGAGRQIHEIEALRVVERAGDGALSAARFHEPIGTAYERNEQPLLAISHRRAHDGAWLWSPLERGDTV